jgi:L-asparaginase
MLSKRDAKVVVLGTGGTIAGLSGSVLDNVGYTSAQVGVDVLARGLVGDGSLCIESEQVAQIDSKDMSFGVWRQLALRCKFHLAREGVAGIVVTHGTDTMEESAYFLHHVLADAGLTRPTVVLTGAMRPASSQAPDGPQNLRDAVQLVLHGGRSGVMVAFAGVVHSALDVRKVHTYRPDAFGSGDAGPLAFLEEDEVRWLRSVQKTSSAKPGALAERSLIALIEEAVQLPRVEMLASGAAADGFALQAMLQYGQLTGDPLRGVVVSATGNGTVHENLLRALLAAQAAGLAVVRATRCAFGRVVPGGNNALSDAGALTPAKARIALMLALLAGKPAPWEMR